MKRDDQIIGHLFIILFNGEPYTSNTIIVPVDTYRSDKQDKTTILQAGDHEFIKKTSFINYGLAKSTSITYINKLIEEKKAKCKPPVSKDILIKVRDGVRKSKRTPNEVLIAYSNHLDRELRNSP